MTLHALQEEVKRRNAAMGRPKKFEGVKQASKLETEVVGRKFEVDEEGVIVKGVAVGLSLM